MRRVCAATLVRCGECERVDWYTMSKQSGWQVYLCEALPPTKW
jgi:hypothetical protein